MRPILTALLLFIVAVAPIRGEFDAAGVSTAKPKATGETFDSGVAASKRLRATQQALELFLAGARPCRFVVVGGLKAPAAQQTINRGSNIPRPKYPKLPYLGGY